MKDSAMELSKDEAAVVEMLLQRHKPLMSFLEGWGIKVSPKEKLAVASLEARIADYAESLREAPKLEKASA